MRTSISLSLVIFIETNRLPFGCLVLGPKHDCFISNIIIFDFFFFSLLNPEFKVVSLNFENPL